MRKAQSESVTDYWHHVLLCVSVCVFGSVCAHVWTCMSICLRTDCSLLAARVSIPLAWMLTERLMDVVDA